jgi:hypothetical protein
VKLDTDDPDVKLEACTLATYEKTFDWPISVCSNFRLFLNLSRDADGEELSFEYADTITGSLFATDGVEAGGLQLGACADKLEFKLSMHSAVLVLQSWRYGFPAGGTTNTALAQALPNGSACEGEYHPLIGNKYISGWVGPNKAATERLATLSKLLEEGALFGFLSANVTE